MDDEQRTASSKFLSYVLRHEPGAIGVALDAKGWVDIDVLLAGCAKHGRAISRAELDEVVINSPKQRFAISEDGRRIRANQGHSVSVDLGYEPVAPPDVLFHGTVARRLPSIREKGLRSMQRHHVHLSADEATARIVGSRRGKPVILRIDARAMLGAGHVFFLTPNGVWLTESVPSPFISGWDDE
ncbi:MAG TPA: RNA 2'-phosphotransferase [Polyangiaceae bacterium]|nr:RNA 2'-phosphotransferase [Polyangiaceae bacterium]